MQGEPQQFGKFIILAGIILICLGALIIVLSKFGLFKLPGDFQFGSKNFKIYFPLASCVILSIVLTLIFWIISTLKK